MMHREFPVRRNRGARLLRKRVMWLILAMLEGKLDDREIRREVREIDDREIQTEILMRG